LPDGPSQDITIYVNGEAVCARAGDTVAAALLGAGHRVTRTTPVSGAGRGPYCMMGACFECLVEIDGEPNRQACMVEVRDGMQVSAMSGARRIAKGRA
jgi:predicted molibdopterin-dependent oxidoreductase YjgC